MAKKKTNSKKLPTFEEALDQLKQCLEALESEDLTLDQSLEKYEMGVSHLKHCHRAIASAKQKIEKLIKIDDDGNPIVETFDNTASEKTTSSTRRKSSSHFATPKKPPENRQNASVDQDDDMDDSDGLF